MWYHRKNKVRAFRLPTNPNETIDHRLILMLNEPEINDQWITTNESTIEIKNEIRPQYATWGDWIVCENDKLYTMTNERFISEFQICIEPAKFDFMQSANVNS